MELATLEPFTLAISNYQATEEGTSRVEITPNRAMGGRATSHIQEWIINQNPLDLIMFNGWTCETSLSRERLQEILNNANRYARPQMQHLETEAPVTHNVVEIDVNQRIIQTRPGVTNRELNMYIDFIRNLLRHRHGHPLEVREIFDQLILIQDHQNVRLNNIALQLIVDEVNNHFARQNR